MLLPETIWVCRFGLTNLYKKKKIVLLLFESNLMELFLNSTVHEKDHP